MCCEGQEEIGQHRAPNSNPPCEIEDLPPMSNSRVIRRRPAGLLLVALRPETNLPETLIELCTALLEALGVFGDQRCL